jgi:hypothetical protein
LHHHGVQVGEDVPAIFLDFYLIPVERYPTEQRDAALELAAILLPSPL